MGFFSLADFLDIEWAFNSFTHNLVYDCSVAEPSNLTLEKAPSGEKTNVVTYADETLCRKFI